MKDTHCSHCGTKFVSLDWPRPCISCKQLTFRNPTPVVIVLHPVVRGGDVGAIIAQRAIEPAIGQWSLISGYMDIGETTEEAAMREFLEETSLPVEETPVYQTSLRNDHGLIMLCFIVPKPMSFDRFLTGKPCPENYQLGVRWKSQPIDLAFPLQSEFTDRWMAGEYGG